MILQSYMLISIHLIESPCIANSVDSVLFHIFGVLKLLYTKSYFKFDTCERHILCRTTLCSCKWS